MYNEENSKFNIKNVESIDYIIKCHIDWIWTYNNIFNRFLFCILWYLYVQYNSIQYTNWNVFNLYINLYKEKLEKKVCQVNLLYTNIVKV